jgi:hypothetical protein
MLQGTTRFLDVRVSPSVLLVSHAKHGIVAFP